MTRQKDNAGIIIYKCGVKVKIILSDITGYITGICIRGDTVSYEVSYNENLNYQTRWFYDFELQFGENIKDRIGFKGVVL